jgi:YHS domain-containing protein
MKTLALVTLSICAAIAATAAAKASLNDPINKVCPITGKDVNATKTVEYEKQTIGFCCDDCKGKFESDPKKYIGKVKEFKKGKKSSSVQEICCCEKDGAEAVSLDGEPINKTCPISGKDVNPTKTVEYEKQLIGFCCDDCKGKFESDPKKYIGKVKEFKKGKKAADEEIAFAADPINKKCPVSGKDVNKEKTSDYEGQTIGFCCDDCKGKFDKEPAKYIGKVKEFKKKKAEVEEIRFDDPINKKCPITGKDIVAGRTAEYEKQTIGFCCKDCVDKFEADPKKFIKKVKEFKKS